MKSLGGLSRLYEWPEDPADLVSDFSSGAWSGISGPWSVEDGVLWLQDAHLSKRRPTVAHPVVLTPGWYTWRVEVKLQDFGSVEEDSGIKVSLKGAPGSGEVLRGTTDWQIVERRHVLLESPDAALGFAIRRTPSGAAWFRNPQLIRHVPPDPDVFLLFPNYRGILWDDRSQIIQVAVWAGDLSVVLEPEASGAGVIKRAPNFGLVTLDASALPHGAYRLRVGDYPPYRIVKLPASARTTMRAYVDPDQVLVLNGQRVFPIGIFDTSGSSPNPENWAKRFQKIAEAPINLYINYWQGSAPERVISALTEGAQRYGIFYLHTVNLWYEDHPGWPASLAQGRSAETLTTEMAQALSTLPGLAGYYTVDEEPLGHPIRGVERVFQQYQTLRENDPGSVTLIAQNKPRELARWRDAGDVFAVDPYPIFGDYPNGYPAPPLAPLHLVLDWMDEAQRRLHRARPLLGDIQFFSPTSKSHWPTYDELRSMSYMAIIAGARGLIYWSYGANALAYVKDPVLREEYWQRLVTVAKEIKALEPFLLAPDAPRRYLAPDGIRTLEKVMGGTRMILTVNSRPEPAEGPGPMGETVRWGPYDVHIYQQEASR